MLCGEMNNGNATLQNIVRIEMRDRKCTIHTHVVASECRLFYGVWPLLALLNR